MPRATCRRSRPGAAPAILRGSIVRKAFRVAEARGRFEIDRVSPVTGAASISVPVLLIHGAEDRETSPAHAERVLPALAGPKCLILVPNAGDNQSLFSSSVWKAIDAWLDDVLGAKPSGR